jgi:N-acetylornithine carbamoyltransferase
MRHFYNLAEESAATIRQLLDRAAAFKKDPLSDCLRGRQFGLIFLAPSLRTRCSFEVGIRQLGGGVTTLEGSMFYGLELRDSVRMDQEPAEHIREAIPVLSRFYAGLGMRIMAEGTSREEDLADYRYRQFQRHAKVPAFNMESSLYHPCQALADLLTIRELSGELRRRRILITWAPHPRPLPTAVPNSILLAATQMGMRVTLARPRGYDLPDSVMANAARMAEASGGHLEVTDDQDGAAEGAEIVYAKSWGALSRYTAPEEEQRTRAGATGWTVDAALMQKTANAWFMHCLPVRRNVVVTDEVIDGPRSAVVGQAENRLHAQKAMLEWLYP